MSEYIPEWVEELRHLVPVVDELREFASNPFGYVWELIITGILAMWGAVLGYLDQVIWVVALEPTRALTASLVEVIWLFATTIAGIYSTIGGQITDLAAGAGLAAPIALVMGWAVPALLTAFLAYAVIAFVETYLPVEPLLAPIRTALSRGDSQ